MQFFLKKKREKEHDKDQNKTVVENKIAQHSKCRDENCR